MRKPKNGNATPLPKFFTSIPQAVSMLNAYGVKCSIADAKKAKRDGCVAWRGHRIYSADLLEWFETNAPEAEADEDTLESKDVLERQKLSEQVKRIRNARLVEEGKLVSIADVRADGFAYGTAIRARLSQFVNNELPSWAGLPAEDLHAKGQAWMTEVLKFLSKPGSFA